MHNAVKPEELRVSFGPNDVLVGAEYPGDPYVDEEHIYLSDFSFLSWLEIFPHWHLLVKSQSPPPLPPGEAETRAASTLDEHQLEPDEAVSKARREVNRRQKHHIHEYFQPLLAADDISIICFCWIFVLSL